MGNAARKKRKQLANNLRAFDMNAPKFQHPEKEPTPVYARTDFWRGRGKNSWNRRERELEARGVDLEGALRAEGIIPDEQRDV